MGKYSEEFKQKVVQEYRKGSHGYDYLTKKHGIGSSHTLRKWIRAYEAFGEDGLKKKLTRKTYSVQFKFNVLHFMKRTRASFLDTAIEFGVTSPSVIERWHHEWEKNGMEGLKKKAKGRPPMSKKQKKNEEKEGSREEQLERENELLRLENAYLKKLRAFRENPEASLEKHKQRWHSSSKKKDFT